MNMNVSDNQNQNANAYQYRSREDEPDNYSDDVLYEGYSVFTVRNVLKILSVICGIFFFCPSFLVSCYGESINVSAMSTVGGVKVYGEKVTDAYPYMLILLAIPVILLVILFMDLMDETKASVLIMVFGGIDVILWLLFRWVVKSTVDDSGLTFKSTIWFFLNLIVLAMILVTCMVIVMGRLSFESDLIVMVSSLGVKESVQKGRSVAGQRPAGGAGTTGSAATGNTATRNTAAGNTPSGYTAGGYAATGNAAANTPAGTTAGTAGNAQAAATPKIIGYCPKCGNPLKSGLRFCSQCGTTVPKAVLDRAGM